MCFNLPQVSEAKEEADNETLAETANRIGAGSIKGALFGALRDAGADGLDVLALVHAVQVRLMQEHAHSRSCMRRQVLC